MLFGNIKNASVKVCITILLFSRSVIPDSLQPHGLQHASSLSFTISLSLLKLMSVESVVPSNHILNGVKVLPLYQTPMSWQPCQNRCIGLSQSIQASINLWVCGSHSDGRIGVRQLNVECLKEQWVFLLHGPPGLPLCRLGWTLELGFAAVSSKSLWD